MKNVESALLHKNITCRNIFATMKETFCNCGKYLLHWESVCDSRFTNKFTRGIGKSTSIDNFYVIWNVTKIGIKHFRMTQCWNFDNKKQWKVDQNEILCQHFFPYIFYLMRQLTYFINVSTDIWNFCKQFIRRFHCLHRFNDLKWNWINDEINCLDTFKRDRTQCDFRAKYIRLSVTYILSCR